MRWCVALALVLAALVVLTVKATRRTSNKAPVVAPEIAEIAGPRPLVPSRALNAPPARQESPNNGVAFLHGRILFPAGADTRRDVTVVAEGAERTLDAKVMEGGHFQIHLPPGRYTLIASAGELIGDVPDVYARGGAERNVDIRLAVGATIRGKVRGATDVSVSATIADRNDEHGVAHVENGAFSIAGLIPGRLYDLSFGGLMTTGHAARTLTLSGVKAPAEGLDVELHERATIRGAVGFERGTTCPIDDVRLWIDGQPDDVGGSAGIGPRCDFEFLAPDQESEVKVVAKGKGWHLEEKVAIPTVGDPAPICLNPPCRFDPDEGPARLRLTLEGAPDGSPISANASRVDITPGTSILHSCTGSAGSCDIESLWPGETLTISAAGRDCRADPMTVTVVAGDNYVRLPCHIERKIEGVIRIPEDQQPDVVTVRCAGGDWHPMSRTRLFKLTCDSGIDALEYRIGSKGTLRSVPIASLAGSGPAFVDIGL